MNIRAFVSLVGAVVMSAAGNIIKVEYEAAKSRNWHREDMAVDEEVVITFDDGEVINVPITNDVSILTAISILEKIRGW